MSDQKPTLEYGRPPPKPRRGRSIIFDIVRGILFAYIVALAIVGFFWLADYIVRVRNGH